MDIKAAEQHDGFFSEDTSVNRIWRINAGIGTESHDSTTSTKALVQTSKVDCSNAVLAESRGTHDAWLDGNVQISLAQDGQSEL